MTRGLRLGAVLVLVLLALAAAFVVRGEGAASGSVLSRGARGWLAARRYLEEGGCRVSLLGAPLQTRTARGVLAVAFPWQKPDRADPGLGIVRHLRAGGTVVLGFDAPSFEQTRILDALGLGWRELRGEPPLHPLRWHEFVRASWSLEPETGAGAGEGPVLVRAPRSVPRAPASARVLYRGEGEVPVVYAFRFAAGEVVVLPAEALSNARLAHPGNADLLEALRSLGAEWTFDEYHHGLTDRPGAGTASAQHAFDLYLLHLVFLYGLVVFALARRFGPAWREAPVLAGTTRSFLVGLGALHHRLGHHRTAARLLLSRARELHPRLHLPGGFAHAAHRADAGGLLELARDVARLQRGKEGTR